jgi:formylglycine-generating enzyme required for sulfatase activity
MRLLNKNMLIPMMILITGISITAGPPLHDIDKKAITNTKISLPGGVFTMGSENGEPDEKPAHKVKLSPFKIDEHEVTNAEYRECVKSGKCAPAHYDDNHCNVMTPQGWYDGIAPSVFKDANKPVTCVNYAEAQAYCASQGGRLPTEAEWEYAARAGTSTKYYWGNDPDKSCGCANTADIDGATVFENIWGNKYPEHANCHDGNPYTAPVKSYKPNAFGLYDMTGNASEWVADWYKDRYEPGSRDSVDKDKNYVNPKGPDTSNYRVVRGGSAESRPDQITTTYRDRSMPFYRMIYFGFRCVY